MDLQRFETLAQAYGGDPSRWPERERAGAEDLIADEPVRTSASLAEAAALDGQLDLWRAPAVSRALREAVVAHVPRPRAAPNRLLWLSGAGLAAAGVAGIVSGAALSSAVLADAHAEATVAAATPDVAATLVSLAAPEGA